MKLLKSVGAVGGMTLLSRVTGLVRDIAFAQFLGSGLMADAFFVAFRIPNFLRRVFGEGAFAVAFVPVYTEYEARYPPHQARAFLELMAGRLSVILLALTVVGVAGAPAVVMAIAPGFLEDPAKYDATVSALRLTFPYLFFISLVAMAGGILNTRDRFVVPAVTPVLLNLCLIGAVWLLLPRMANAAVALGLGVLLAGAVQFAFQLPFLRVCNRLPRPRLKAHGSNDEVGAQGVQQVFRLMLPALFGVSIAQINLLVNTLLASFLVTGSVSWLYYSDRLMEFPLGVFGIALAIVILPTLSAQYTRAAEGAFADTLDWALRLVFLVTVPAAAALAVLAFPLMVVLFQRGEFSPNDALMAARSLVAFALGLVPFALVKVLAPGFYARQDTKTPVRAGAVAMVVNALAAVVLVFSLAHVGLALATSVAGVVNAALLYRYLVRDTGFTPAAGWGGFLARITLATLAMVVLLWYGMGEAQIWLDAPVLERVGRLAGLVLAGGGVYLAALYLLGIRVHRFLR
ncbi:MAG: murein biosynthesis integral membrane protein MurJ [Arenicellales bacterium]|nr:murein biosynthesis integral membrane protein MurJ [Arenicellales bacterium]